MDMNFTEHAIVFPCQGDELLGIVTSPERPNKTGILFIVGGPQYRVGSHRQFLLLSRALANAGFPTMRFDHAGMGDSTGVLTNFEAVKDNISAAIRVFQQRCPSVANVILWGLCDAASASLLYWDETRDPLIAGIILLNPWVRSEATLAKTHIKHYYGQRLLQIEFWRKLLTGRVGVGPALSGVITSILRARRTLGTTNVNAPLPFQKRMMRALMEFQGQLLLVLSGDDFTAKEFLEAVRADTVGAIALQRNNLRRVDVVGADHTFSSAEWRRSVEVASLDWLETSVR